MTWCLICIHVLKLNLFYRFNKCEEVGMMKSWVMNEEERLQLMKSRLTKKYMETGDEDALRDQSLFSNYSGRVALTAGGAPNLHGLNRRRHMENRIREEGEVDPALYGSMVKKSKSTSEQSDSGADVSDEPNTSVVKQVKTAPKRGRPRKSVNQRSSISSNDNTENENRSLNIEEPSDSSSSSKDTTWEDNNGGELEYAAQRSSSMDVTPLTPSPSPQEIFSSSSEQKNCSVSQKGCQQQTLDEECQFSRYDAKNHSRPYLGDKCMNVISNSSQSYMSHENINMPHSKFSSELLDSLSKDFDESCDSGKCIKNQALRPLTHFPKDPDKYTVMINERPPFNITSIMNRQELEKVCHLVQTMKKVECKFPYSTNVSSSDVMLTYANFIKRITCFLQSFEEFQNLSLDNQNKAIRENITTIALVFGSSFLNKDGMYKNVLHTPTALVTSLNSIEGVLTQSVFSTFQEVIGVLSQFLVDMRMAYMIIFTIVFREDSHYETHNFYKRLLYHYISWKYGPANAQFINQNLYKAIECIRKQAHVFECMTTDVKEPSVERAKIIHPSDIKKEGDCENERLGQQQPRHRTPSASSSGSETFEFCPGHFTPRASPEQVRKFASMGKTKSETLKSMFYSGASISDLRKVFYAEESSNMENSSENRVFNNVSSNSVPVEEPLANLIQPDIQSSSFRCDNANYENFSASATCTEGSAMQNMIAKHGKDKLKQMYEGGKLSDLKSLFQNSKTGTSSFPQSMQSLVSLYGSSTSAQLQKFNMEEVPPHLQALASHSRIANNSSSAQLMAESGVSSEPTNSSMKTVSEGHRHYFNKPESLESKTMELSGKSSSSQGEYSFPSPHEGSYLPGKPYHTYDASTIRDFHAAAAGIGRGAAGFPFHPGMRPPRPLPVMNHGGNSVTPSFNPSTFPYPSFPSYREPFPSQLTSSGPSTFNPVHYSGEHMTLRQLEERQKNPSSYFQ